MKMIAAVLVLFAVTSQAANAGMRCHTRIVQVGDNMADVLDKCGEPNRTFNHSLLVRTTSFKARPYKEEVAEQVLVDVWVYRMSRGQFSRSVVFAGGEVIDIKLGDRSF